MPEKLTSDLYTPPKDHKKRLILTMGLMSTFLLFLIRPHPGTYQPSGMLALDNAQNQYNKLHYAPFSSDTFASLIFSPNEKIFDQNAITAYPFKNQDFRESLNLLKALRIQEIESKNLLAAHYEDTKLQGIYGESLHLRISDKLKRNVEIHLYGANGIDDAGKVDDYKAASWKNDQWLQYTRPFLLAYHTPLFVQHVWITLLLLLIFAPIFFLLVCRARLHLNPYHLWLFGLPYWLLLTIGYTAYLHITCFLFYPETYDFYSGESYLPPHLESWEVGYIATPIITYMISILFHIPLAIGLLRKHFYYRSAQKKFARQICPRCNYDLRASIKDEFNCPECDLAIRREHVALDALPGV